MHVGKFPGSDFFAVKCLAGRNHICAAEYLYRKIFALDTFILPDTQIQPAIFFDQFVDNPVIAHLAARSTQYGNLLAAAFDGDGAGERIGIACQSVFAIRLIGRNCQCITAGIQIVQIVYCKTAAGRTEFAQIKDNFGCGRIDRALNRNRSGVAVYAA